MSGKIKKHSDFRQSGFLKPTVASQGRSIKHSNRSLSSPNHKIKKKSLKKKPKLEDKSLSKSISPSGHHGKMALASAVEMYSHGVKSASKETVSISSSDHPGLNDAKKMCEELKEQINDLKLHQEVYEERLNNTHSANRNHSYQSHLKPSKSSSSSENLQVKHLHKSQSIGEHGNQVIRVNVNRKDQPFQDTSNLPEQLSYNSLFCKPDASDSIIKKLNLERDRYKRKVIKLQQELKQMKKQKGTLLKSPEIPLHELSFYNADMVGEGRLAVVYEGTLCGKPVAVKKLIRSGIMTSSDRSYLAAEAGLLVPLEHRNIIKVMGVCSSPMEPLIVTEFVNGNTVSDMLSKSGGNLDSAIFFSIARDSAVGLAYLHSQKPPVLHLNLRPSNVMVDSFVRAKVADFGFSKIRIDAGVSNCSNLAYLAPELLKFPAQITTKTDVYAFAILMWHMTTGKDPMAQRTTSQILDMLEHGQRLHIPSDLPLCIQQLIRSCWDPSAMRRPTFKEIIVEFETMLLPNEWISKLKEIGIARTDTSDMCSNARDTASLTSSMTSSNPEAESRNHHLHGESYLNSTKKSPDFYQSKRIYTSPVSPPLNGTDKFKNDQFASRPRDGNEEVVGSHTRRKRESPVPLNDVCYVYHNLHNHISTPEIVQQTSKLSWEDQRSKLPLSTAAEFRDARSPSGKPTTSTARFAWSGEPYASENRSKDVSKFDSKFRDYVSEACQAESTHRAYTSAYRSWPNLPSSTYAQKSKSLLSSENIQVRSVGTPSCSTMASSSKSSSLDTAVYVPNHYRHAAEPYLTNTSTIPGVATRVSSAPLRDSGLSSKLESDLHKGTSILNNAKRLLSTSPLYNFTKPASRVDYRHPQKYLTHPDIKPLPEYRPSHLDHKSYVRDSGYVRSESSKSDMSIESFLPLPPKLQNHPCLLTNDNLNKSNDTVTGRTSDHHPSSGNSENMSVEANTHDQGDEGVGEEKSDDKVSRILNRTAEELHNASSMLYTASEELRKQKLNGAT